MSTGSCKITRATLAAAAMSIAAMLSQPASAQGQTHRIEMKTVAFAPAQIAVRVGDTLEWENNDFVAHTATSKDGGFEVDVLPGQKGALWRSGPEPSAISAATTPT